MPKANASSRQASSPNLRCGWAKCLGAPLLSQKWGRHVYGTKVRRGCGMAPLKTACEPGSEPFQSMTPDYSIFTHVVMLISVYMHVWRQQCKKNVSRTMRKERNPTLLKRFAHFLGNRELHQCLPLRIRVWARKASRSGAQAASARICSSATSPAPSVCPPVSL